MVDSTPVLKDNVVLITGGSGSLGSAFARAMSTAGADVVIAGRDEGRLKETATRISDETGGRVGFVSGDLSDRSAHASLAEDAWTTFGHVDTVLNSAVQYGGQKPAGDLLTTPDDAWWSNFDPIVLGALGLAKGLVPRMAEHGGGAFINITSPTGILPYPGMDAYGIAKGALLMLTKYMAKEWGKWNIRANAISPGLIVDGHTITAETVMASPQISGLLERTSLGRIGLPEDLVGVAVFLASDASRFMSGQVLPVDGGRF